MAEYIEREKPRYIDANKIQYVVSENGCLDDYAYRYDINEIPAADVVEVRHGVWEEADNTKRGQKFICSVCKGVSYYTQPTRDKKWVKHCGYPHCPHCLAKMDGKGEGE